MEGAAIASPYNKCWGACRARPALAAGLDKEHTSMVDEAIARCLAFQAAGADIVYAEGLETQGACVYIALLRIYLRLKAGS